MRLMLLMGLPFFLPACGVGTRVGRVEERLAELERSFRDFAREQRQQNDHVARTGLCPEVVRDVFKEVGKRCAPRQPCRGVDINNLLQTRLSQSRDPKGHFLTYMTRADHRALYLSSRSGHFAVTPGQRDELSSLLRLPWPMTTRFLVATNEDRQVGTYQQATERGFAVIQALEELALYAPSDRAQQQPVFLKEDADKQKNRLLHYVFGFYHEQERIAETDLDNLLADQRDQEAPAQPPLLRRTLTARSRRALLGHSVWVFRADCPQGESPEEAPTTTP